MNLNTEQLAIINSEHDKIIAICGAGSGKSTVLVASIKRLVAAGHDPSKFIVITFTTAAARVLQERLDGIRLGYCGTLHSFMLRLIGEHHDLVGLPAALSVADDDATEGLLESIMAGMGVKIPVKKVLPLLKLAAYIEPAKSMSRSKEELVAIEFHSQLRASGLLTFDTILYWGNRVIERMMEWPYTHLLADEVQDSADEDWAIYESMPCPNKFLVGDDAQAIFGFRAGNVSNLIRYAKEAPDNGYSTFTLQTNYRCARAICVAADRLICHNTDRYDKVSYPATEGGTVTVTQCAHQAAEMATVLNGVSEALSQPQGSTVAVLARTNAVAGAFASYLESMGVPVAKRKQVELPEDWRLAKAWMTAMANPFNDMAAYQYLVASTDKPNADKIRQQATIAMKPIYQIATPFAFDPFPIEQMSKVGLSNESIDRINAAAVKLGMKEVWNYNDLIVFLANDETDSEPVGNGVFVGTFHAAKGREWDACFLVGCEEGLFPMLRKDSDVSEERRLAFVAFTRARSKLCISWCANRPKPFTRENVKCEPSRFIAEAGL